MNKVNFDFPKWRVWLFPFYSTHEVVFILALIVTTTVVVYQLKLPGAVWQYAVVGYVGAALVNRGSSPAHIVYAKTFKPKVEDVLSENGLRYDSKSASWLSPLPRFLVWKHGRVSLSETNGNLEIRAPYRFLVYLARELAN